MKEYDSSFYVESMMTGCYNVAVGDNSGEG